MLVVIDTETTGLSNDAQVVSFAAIVVGETPDADQTLADCIVRPVREGWQTAQETMGAFAVNGHTIEQIEATQVFLPMVWSDFAAILRRYWSVTLVAHNAEFDRRVVRQSLGGEACSPRCAEIPNAVWACSRPLPWPTPVRSLDAICAHYAITAPAARHTALGDCQRLLQAMRSLHAETGSAEAFRPWVLRRLLYL
jgi:DNA polymerase III epsilon subunit-like protein